MKIQHPSTITDNGKLWLITIAVWVALCLALIFGAGCASVKFNPQTGEVTRRSWLWADTQIQSFEMQTDSNGVTRVSFEGYNQANDETIAGIVNAAVSGAIMGYKQAQTGGL